MAYISQKQLLLKNDEQLRRQLLAANSSEERYFAYLALPVGSIKRKEVRSDFLFLQSVNQILSLILEISRNPNFKVDKKDTVIRSSLVSNFDNEEFQATLRDSSLWRRKSGVLRPEYAHTSEATDNFDTYENKLLKMCFNYIVNKVEQLKNDYSEHFSALSQSFDFNNYSYASVFNYQKNRLLNQKSLKINADLQQMLGRLHVIERKINHIERSYLFKQLENTAPIKDRIMATNTIKFDHKYNKVFRFYIEALKDSKDESYEGALLNYYIGILLKSVEKEFKLAPVKQVVNFKNFNLKYLNDNFSLNLRRIKNNTFLFTTKVLKKPGINAMSSLSIVTKKENYQSPKTGLAYEYVLVQKNFYRFIEGKFIPLKYNLAHGEHVLMQTLLVSLFFKVPLQDNYNVALCPVCGHTNTGFKINQSETCSECRSEYALIDKKDTPPTIWLKKVSIKE